MSERVCKACGIQKPLEDFAKQLSGRRGICKTCINLRQTAYRKQQTWIDQDRQDWVHDPPATMGPIRKPWDLTCQMCGEHRQFRWTAQEARLVSLHLVTHKIKCERCGGWLLLEPGLQAFDDPTRRGRAAA